jgi:ABC-type branched-subunit amino acid transport system substrate-binding protein
MVLREYARRRPETTFMIQPSDAPELTLTKPAPNVFRFVPDAAQGAAGLGSYAYRKLGWRTAVMIGDDFPYGWGNVSGFVAEFCALGGRVLEPHWIPYGTDPASVVPQIPASADGVYLGTALAPTPGFLRRYSEVHPDLGRRLVVNAVQLAYPHVADLSKGVVFGGPLPSAPTPAVANYVASFKRAFPRLPAYTALDPLALSYRDAVAAALGALERADSDTGRSFRAALAGFVLDSPMGPIRLDRNRQAVVNAYLSRVGSDAKGHPRITTLRVVPGVEETFGGYFAPDSPPPTRTQPACRKTTPPRWAAR